MPSANDRAHVRGLSTCADTEMPIPIVISRQWSAAHGTIVNIGMGCKIFHSRPVDLAVFNIW